MRRRVIRKISGHGPLRLRQPGRNGKTVTAIHASLAELKRQGKFVGKVPFGFDSVGEKYDEELVPNEWGKKYIPEIFHRVIKGDSVQVVARWLTDEGVPAGRRKRMRATDGGRVWFSASSRILCIPASTTWSTTTQTPIAG